MKFLLIINNEIDGVGQPAINLCSNIKKKGHKAKIISLHKFTKNKDVIKIKRSIILRFFLFLLSFLMKDFSDLFGFGYSTTKYSEIKKHVEESDIIIIYTFYKILSNDMLFKILTAKKIVYFRPLDIELASGGCHFNENCQKFKSNCQNCPRLYFDFNLPKANLLKKKEIFERFKPLIFAPDNYVKNLFKNSTVFKNIRTETIYIGTNKSRSKFYSKIDARKQLKIDQNEKIILFGAFNLASHIKGGHLLVDSLKLLESKYLKKKQNNIHSKKIRLLTIGEKNTFCLDTSIIKWTHLGKISTHKRLNLLYRAADVLVCPSLYCFASNIVTEALMNDLPAVAFDIGIAQDSIINGTNGYVVPCYDKLIFAKSIYKVLSSKKNKSNSATVKRIKSQRSSLCEANSIINAAKTDLNKKRAIRTHN